MNFARHVSRKTFFTSLAVLWAGVIFVGSSIPGSTLPAAPSVVPFVVHLVEYFILGMVVVSTLYHFHDAEHVRDTLLIGMLYAFTDEVHQLFVVGRHFDVRDLLVDLLGIALGTTLVVVIRKRKRLFRD